MKADVVIMDGMVLDAITKENKDLRKKLQEKTADVIELSKKLVDLEASYKEYGEITEKLVWELIKENNKLHRQIDEQATVEQSLWNTIWGLEHQIRFNDEEMEEFN